MKAKIFLMILMAGLAALPLGNLYAATIEEVISQVNVYKTSGEISDEGFGANLVTILNAAKSKRNAGDTAGKDGELGAFRDAVEGASGLLLTSTAASHLTSMAQ